jgi:hypothetical protein
MPIQVEIKDGVLTRVEPESIVACVAVPIWRWYENLSYA